MQSRPNWWDAVTATFIADLSTRGCVQIKVWVSPAHKGGLEGVHSAEKPTWFWSALLLFNEMLSLDLILALERKALALYIHKRKPI